MKRKIKLKGTLEKSVSYGWSFWNNDKVEYLNTVLDHHKGKHVKITIKVPEEETACYLQDGEKYPNFSQNEPDKLGKDFGRVV